MDDVLIVGAGTGGLTAARALLIGREDFQLLAGLGSDRQTLGAARA